MKHALAVIAALCLSACSTVGNGQLDTAEALTSAANVTAATVTTWCGLPLATRVVLRDRLTNGLQFVRCPDDLAP